jgi:hypothetical protein
MDYSINTISIHKKINFVIERRHHLKCNLYFIWILLSCWVAERTEYELHLILDQRVLLFSKSRRFLSATMQPM